MKYIITIEECNEPNTVRFWGEVEGLPGCHIAENTLDEFYQTAPEIIKTIIETSNERGSTFPIPTAFEFHLTVSA